MNDSFIFYRSFYEALNELPDKERLEVYDAICSYSINKKLPELNGVSKAIFTLIKPQIDANLRKRENGKKGKEYGKLGGRPKTIKTHKKPQENRKQTPNVNANVNVNVNANVNKNDNIIDVPSFVDGDLFLDFIKHRKSIKSPMTEKAVSIFVNKLHTFHNNGYNVNECMETAIESGWKTIYEPKKGYNNGNNKSDKRKRDLIDWVDGR